jgi:hypothetical protein
VLGEILPDLHFPEIVFLRVLLPLPLDLFLLLLSLPFDEFARFDLSVAVPGEGVLLLFVVDAIGVVYSLLDLLVFILKTSLALLKLLKSIYNSLVHFIFMLSYLFLDFKFVIVVNSTLISSNASIRIVFLKCREPSRISMMS